MRLRTIGFFMVVSSLVISAILLYSISIIQKDFDELLSSTEAYLQAQNNATELKNTTDYLIEQARNYVVSGDLKYLNDYYNEYENLQNREKAVEALEPKMQEVLSYPHLRMAYNFSKKLNEMEAHAFILSLKARKVDFTDYPEQLKTAIISNAEEEMSVQEKIDLAVSLLFSEKYADYKSNMDENINFCISGLASLTDKEKNTTISNLAQALITQRYFILASVSIVLLTVLIIWLHIIRPLSENLQLIEKQEFLKTSGLKELRVLSDAYNNMFARVRKDNEKLSYEATHDGLTGIYNRAAYNSYFDNIDDENICMFLIDVDDFKKINDNYGHDVGDEVLKKVARLLESSFRKDDRAFRLGGDEMCVIMRNVDESNRELITRKYNSIAEELGKQEDGIPAITISVGVAFSNDGIAQDALYKNADSALYHAKKDKKSKIVFYEQ